MQSMDLSDPHGNAWAKWASFIPEPILILSLQQCPKLFNAFMSNPFNAQHRNVTKQGEDYKCRGYWKVEIRWCRSHSSNQQTRT